EAMIWNSRGRVASERMVWNGATGQMTAEGHVFTTYFPAPSSGAHSPEPVQIVAEQLQYASATDRAQYRGKVRLWQGKSLLETDRLELDRKQEQLSAQGNVYSVFQQLPKGSQRRQEQLEIRSHSLLYGQKDRKAQYQGDVRMQSASANLTATELEVFLERGDSKGAPATSTGVEQIEHAVARGNVQILEGARKASATWAEYFPARGEVRLFGEPAVVEDPRRGATRGVRLTYRIGDDSMAVDGKPGLPAETRRQVLR
ncbi:MAG: LptA/OstA family protein, partial [bacterium]|nr:LptA/OstA family protein [bacterium]